jgi:hypothetical protein
VLERPRLGFLCIVVGILSLLINVGCARRSPDSMPRPGQPFSISGEVKPVQMTTYMYGSHQLVTNKGLYAISSAKGSGINLNEYEGERITARVSRVEGYPVDGGPPYLFVHEIK